MGHPQVGRVKNIGGLDKVLKMLRAHLGCGQRLPRFGYPRDGSALSTKPLSPHLVYVEVLSSLLLCVKAALSKVVMMNLRGDCRTAERNYLNRNRTSSNALKAHEDSQAAPYLLRKDHGISVSWGL